MIFSQTVPERGEQTEQMIFSKTLLERGEQTEQMIFSQTLPERGEQGEQRGFVTKLRTDDQVRLGQIRLGQVRLCIVMYFLNAFLERGEQSEQMIFFLIPFLREVNRVNR